MSLKGGLVLLILIIGIFLTACVYFVDQSSANRIEINLDTFDTQIEEELTAIGAKTIFAKYAQQGSITLFSESEFISKIKSGDEVYISLVFLPKMENIKQVLKRYYSVKYDISYDEEIRSSLLEFKKHSFRLVNFDNGQGGQGYLVLEKTINFGYLSQISIIIIFILISAVVFLIPD